MRSLDSILKVSGPGTLSTANQFSMELPALDVGRQQMGCVGSPGEK